MLGWVYRTLVGSFSVCNHKWKVIRTIQVTRASDDELMGYQYTQECEHCGNLKKTSNKLIRIRRTNEHSN